MGPVDSKHGSQENHTLGNALRHVLLMNPRVMFAGYSMPHPFEDQMHLRIQTAEDYPAQEALKQALQDSASKSSIRRFVITEKAPTRAFSWLKAATTAFTFKTLLRHYAKRALTPQVG